MQPVVRHIQPQIADRLDNGMIIHSAGQIVRRTQMRLTTTATGSVDLRQACRESFGTASVSGVEYITLWLQDTTRQYSASARIQADLIPTSAPLIVTPQSGSRSRFYYGAFPQNASSGLAVEAKCDTYTSERIAVSVNGNTYYTNVDIDLTTGYNRGLYLDQWDTNADEWLYRLQTGTFTLTASIFLSIEGLPYFLMETADYPPLHFATTLSNTWARLGNNGSGRLMSLTSTPPAIFNSPSITAGAIVA